MAYRSRKPVRMVGGIINSGNLDTGEVAWTRGGQKVATIQSGADAIAPRLFASPGAIGSGTSAILWSGTGGRLNTIIALQAISGVAQALFYDSAGALASGPLMSGNVSRVVIGVLPANTFGGVGLGGPIPIAVDAPFYSGLCVAALSGCAGFTAIWTPAADRSGAGDELN